MADGEYSGCGFRQVDVEFRNELIQLLSWHLMRQCFTTDALSRISWIRALQNVCSDMPKSALNTRSIKFLKFVSVLMMLKDCEGEGEGVPSLPQGETLAELVKVLQCVQRFPELEDNQDELTDSITEAKCQEILSYCYSGNSTQAKHLWRKYFEMTRKRDKEWPIANGLKLIIRNISLLSAKGKQTSGTAGIIKTFLHNHSFATVHSSLVDFLAANVHKLGEPALYKMCLNRLQLTQGNAESGDFSPEQKPEQDKDEEREHMDVPAEQKAVEVDLGHSSNDFSSPEQQGIGKVDNEPEEGVVEETEGDAMDDGDATNQLEGRENKEQEEPIRKDVKRVDVDSSKNEHGEEEIWECPGNKAGTTETSEGEAMEDDDATQSEGNAINQQEGGEEREEEDPIIISSEAQTSERKRTLRCGKVPQFKFADEDRDGDIIDWSEDSDPISTPPSHLPTIRSTIRVRNRRSLIGKPSPTKTIRKTRVPFTAKEVEYLEEGIEKFGVGNWKEIIKHYKFNPRRTNQDLKDKWRNLMKYSKV